MQEIIVTVVTTDGDIPITKVKRIEFDRKADLDLWVNRCADLESPMLDPNCKFSSTGIKVTNVEDLTAF